MLQARLERERRTIAAMIELYCHARHRPAAGLCAECEQLLAYAMQRIDKCPFRANKPTCAKCTVHCYKPEMRRQVREVMRYAGPRMILRHPVMAIMHYIDAMHHARNKQK
jgi:hypothetical protein